MQKGLLSSSKGTRRALERDEAANEGGSISFYRPACSCFAVVGPAAAASMSAGLPGDQFRSHQSLPPKLRIRPQADASVLRSWRRVRLPQDRGSASPHRDSSQRWPCSGTSPRTVDSNFRRRSKLKRWPRPQPRASVQTLVAWFQAWNSAPHGKFRNSRCPARLFEWGTCWGIAGSLNLFIPQYQAIAA